MNTTRESGQAGYVSGMLVSVIALSVALAATIGVGIWAFVGRQDYKNNTDKKIEAAVTVAKQATETADGVKYAEEAKNPLQSYVGPSTYGSVTIKYPKTWSGYVVERASNTSTPLDDYFHPDVVPDTGDGSDNAFALRAQIVQQAYDKVVSSHDGAVKNRKLSSRPYTLPKVSSVTGTRFEGELSEKKSGVLIVLPVRNVTLQIWTEGDQYRADFNNIILPNLTFSP